MSGHNAGKHITVSLIRTIPSVQEFHLIGPDSGFADCDCRWGIAPRPETFPLYYTAADFACKALKILFILRYKTC